MPFVCPYGVPDHLVPLFLQASQVFRMFDRDFSGRLSKKEFKLAMFQLGYRVDKYHLKNMFFMIDRDRSGRIDEREFTEFWVYSQNYHQTGFGQGYQAYGGYQQQPYSYNPTGYVQPYGVQPGY